MNYILLDELEVDCSSIIKINKCEQVWTPNCHPQYDIPQSCGDNKYIFRFGYVTQELFSIIQGYVLG